VRFRIGLAKKMTMVSEREGLLPRRHQHAAEFRETLEEVGLSSSKLAQLLDRAPRTTRHWRYGTRPIPRETWILLRLAQTGKISVANIEEAAAPSRTNGSATPDHEPAPAIADIEAEASTWSRGGSVAPDLRPAIADTPELRPAIATDPKLEPVVMPTADEPVPGSGAPQAADLEEVIVPTQVNSGAAPDSEPIDLEAEAPTWTSDPESADPDPELAFEPTIDQKPTAPEAGVSFCALSRETCRWPTWRDGETPSIDALKFCGAPPVGCSPYCDKHSLMACKDREALCLNQPRRKWSRFALLGPRFTRL
jgi:hypothetical protein